MEDNQKHDFREIKMIVFAALAIILFLSLVSYHPYDIAWYTTEPNDPPNNLIGILGAWSTTILFFSFGFATFIIPIILFVWFVLSLLGKNISTGNYIVSLVFIIALACIPEIFPFEKFVQQASKYNIIAPGGLIAHKLTDKILLPYIGKLGSLFLLLATMVFSLLKITETNISTILNFISDYNSENTDFTPKRQTPAPRKKPALFKKKKEAKVAKEPIKQEKPKPLPKKAPAFKAKPPKNSKKYRFPDLRILETPPKKNNAYSEDINSMAQILEETLLEFGIESNVINVVKGPVITRYELQIAPGIKVNRITALADDIAMCMKAISVRIIAPIPGKNAIGIEIPNKKASLVYLKELMSGKNFSSSDFMIPLFVGKDIAGDPLIEDLAELPHLLIAGSTGSGKTVCINALIMGMLFTKTPDELKMLMIDPKRVEMTQYAKLPHLVCPIITESKLAVIALSMMVKEMEDRYKTLAKVRTRNIIQFNSRNIKKDPEGENIPEKLPYIVVIVDELADLMMTASSDIETSIARLAQLARAVGIHLILATQRPSVNVITGIIKANFPARMSFKVSSKVDSRTILDANGAEKLLGKGDLLFLPPKISKLLRAQSTLISDHEINETVEYIAAQREQDFNEKFVRLSEGPDMEDLFEDDVDEFYEEAVKFIMQQRQASASMLQRKFRVGYNRASRMIEMMESNGIVGPFNGSRVREILIDPNKDF